MKAGLTDSQVWHRSSYYRDYNLIANRDFLLFMKEKENVKKQSVRLDISNYICARKKPVSQKPE